MLGSTAPVKASDCVKQWGSTPSVGNVTDSVVVPDVNVPVALSNNVWGTTKSGPSFRYTARPMSTGEHSGSSPTTVKVAVAPSALNTAVRDASAGGVHEVVCAAAVPASATDPTTAKPTASAMVTSLTATCSVCGRPCPGFPHEALWGNGHGACGCDDRPRGQRDWRRASARRSAARRSRDGSGEWS